MKLTNPNGLWLLLLVPILILIYLIKSSHEDRPLSSTYLWKLSRRFAKKRTPLNRLRKLMLFILQLVMIVVIAVVAAKPVVTEGECFDFVVILDASAGMQMEDGEGQSRFDRAVEEINALGRELSNGHTMSVILAGDTPTCLVQGAKNTEDVKVALKNAGCTNGICDLAQAVSMAQKICDRSDNAKVMFYTDREPAQAGNIHVVNMDANEQNVSVMGLSVQSVDKDLVFKGKISAYPEDANVTVGLRLDGKLVDAKNVLCTQKGSSVVFTVQNTPSFETAEIFIEKKDGLSLDNSYAICRKNLRKNRVLLVSASPLYLESALLALGNCEVEVASGLEGTNLQGKDLYIFDGITPEEYPLDGSVVVFGTENMPDGLAVGKITDDVTKLMMLDANNPICVDVLLDSAVIKGYGALSYNSQWKDVLYCRNTVVAASTKRDNGTRMVVFAFDIHNTNLPLQADFLLLMRNLVEFSVPGLISSTEYVVSDVVQITVPANFTELFVKRPDGSVKTLYADENGAAMTVSEVGLHTIVMKTEEGASYADFFVGLNVNEPYSDSEDVINILLMPKEDGETKEAMSAIWFWFALLVLFILLVEWEWYYYEQY